MGVIRFAQEMTHEWKRRTHLALPEPEAGLPGAASPWNTEPILVLRDRARFPVIVRESTRTSCLNDFEEKANLFTPRSVVGTQIAGMLVIIESVIEKAVVFGRS